MRRTVHVRSKIWRGPGVLIAFSLLLSGIFGLALTPEAGAEKAKQTMVLDVAPSAQVEKVGYFFKTFKGKETIHFLVTVKNISAEPKRFKVLVSIDEGPSTAYYYPRKGKPPVIKPGASYGKPLPLVFYDKPPQSFLIKVSEM